MQIISGKLDELVLQFRDCWIGAASVAIKKKGVFHVAFSGGRSPAPFLSALMDIDRSFWSKTCVYQVDERFVDQDHQDQNWRMIQEVLLNNVDCLKSFPMVIDTTDIDKQVERYNQLTNNITLDLVLLGIGDDGHTASLFPEIDYLNHGHDVVKTKCSYLPYERISLSLKKINAAEQCFFIVLGENKSKIIKGVLDQDPQYPASHIKTKQSSILFTTALI